MKRILIIFSNPKGTDQLRLGTEDRTIRECINLSKNRDSFIVEIKHAATIHDFRRALLESEYHVIHFSGHGMDRGFVLENELGENQIIPPNALYQLLSSYSPPLECVILNACHTREHGNLYSTNIPFTIAMNGPISDPAAIEFSRGFYDAIAAGKDIQFSYQEGCTNIKLSALQQGSTPILIKSLYEELKGFFYTNFPNLPRSTETNLPFWLQKDILKVFKLSISRAKFTKSGLLTTRHIFLALFELENSITSEVILCLGGNVSELIKEYSKNIDISDFPAQKLQPTVFVKEIIMNLDKIFSKKCTQQLDDGIILQVALDIETDSVSVDELLKDINCNAKEMLQTISEIRAKRTSTPPRK